MTKEIMAECLEEARVLDRRKGHYVFDRAIGVIAAALYAERMRSEVERLTEMLRAVGIDPYPPPTTGEHVLMEQDFGYNEFTIGTSKASDG